MDPTDEHSEYGALLLFPRSRRFGGQVEVSGARGLAIIREMRCVVCATYGCVPVRVTAPDWGGQLTGDNLLPVCPEHAKVALIDLWCRHPQVHRWLTEHERIDAIAVLDRLRVKLKLKKHY